MKITVTLRDQQPVDVEAENPDRVRWDMTAAQKKWPSLGDAPFLGVTFMAWAAMRRLGLYSGTFEQFWEHDCVDTKAEAEDDEPDPTQTAAPLDF